MRCDDVIRELAVPSDDRDSTALAEHLKICQSCAGWAERAALLDRLWEATRPPEPSSQAWDTLWRSIFPSIDRSTAKGGPSLPSPWKFPNGQPRQLAPAPSHERRTATTTRRMALPAIGLLGLAQAAAVLIAIGVGGRSHHTPQTNQSTESREPAHSTRSVVHFASPITIEEGHLVVIREEGQPHELQLPVFLSRFTLVPISVEEPALRVVDMTPDGISVAVDDWYVMFNAVEWIDRPVVAMKE